tara:strand:- start:711 stop:1208 length:498 start_codon:yes stop_codon:yes gene_type:complete
MRKKKFIPYRRKLEGKTNYRKRLEMLKSGKLRLVVRKSLKNMTIQLVEFKVDGDKTVFGLSSKALSKYGWTKYRRNIPAAYLLGLAFGVEAQKKGLKEAVFDLGLYKSRKGSVLFSVLNGVVDSGMDVHHNKEVFPSAERIIGKHISEEIVKEFEKVKGNIQKVK